MDSQSPPPIGSSGPAEPATLPTAERRAERVLWTSQLASAIGDGSFYVTSALFFAHVLGMTPAAIGLALTAAWGTGFLLTTPIGHWGDRFGLRGTAVVLSLLTAASLVIMVFARAPALFVAALILYAVVQSGSGAVRQALLVTLIAPDRRVRVRAHLQTIVNGGIAVGAGIGGAALYVGTTAAFVAVFAFDAVTFVLAAGLLLRLPATPRVPPTAKESKAAVLRDRPYVMASFLNAVLYLYMPMLSVLLPLFVVQRTDAPGWMAAALFVLNTAGVLLFQVPVAKRITTLPRAAWSVRLAGFAFLATCLVFWLASAVVTPYLAVAVLVLGVGLQVLGEVYLAAGSWEIGFGLADPERPGQWQGLYSSGIPVARALGPIALTTLVLTWHGPGWPVLGLVFLAAALAMTPVVAWGQRRRTRTE